MKITPVIDSIADCEFGRFTATSVRMSGSGWYDPINGSLQMPSGVSGEQWDAFLADCRNLGKGVRA